MKGAISVDNPKKVDKEKENTQEKADTPQKIDPRSMENLYRAFENADFIVRKRYRADLDKYPVCDLPKQLSDVILDAEPADRDSETQTYTLGDNVQFVKVEKLVYDKKENIADKLTTVYHTMSSFKNTGVVMVLHSDGMSVDIYLGVAERISDHGVIDIHSRGNKLSTLKTAFEANFPGSSVVDLVNGRPIDKKAVIRSFSQGVQAISCVTGIASLRNKNSSENSQFVQGPEKLIDAMRGKAFSAVFIADCKGIAEIEKLCADYENIYSELSPFAQSQQTIGKTTGVTDTESFIKGVTDTTNESISDAVSHGHTSGSFISNTVGGSVTAEGIAKVPLIAESSVSTSVNYSHTKGKSTSESDTTSKTKTSGTSQSLTNQNSVAKSIATSTNDGLQISFQNRAVKTLMDQIDGQIKHLRACEAYGVFDFSCYFLAEESAVSLAAASVYDSLMRGDESGAEVSSVSIWTDKNADTALTYLKRFYPPLIAIPNLSAPAAEDDQAGTYDILPITPSTVISGKEIALHMGLPKKSVPGIPVTECAEFGRNVISRNEKAEGTIRLGKIYHMQRPEAALVKLNVNSLTAHTFITGSTGSGKSNTIYTLLNELCFNKGDTHFMVIEPAKGEYKQVFGGYPNVSVYGTNFKTAQLLRLNPFSFPDEIHVLEHIDRLVEIFNACWPMYAAMPAVLKDAIEASYISCGWSLTHSVCEPKRFPTFETLLRKLPEIMDSSAYSKDTKGDYTGALVTRVKSLTNGINGQIFCSDAEVSNQQLFDQNVIIDLSRVGSMETKSLLMGILMIKLQEYRMAEAKGSNAGLRHVTVLEEAHNLLRRTSSEQSQDSSNLQGKSVEMLANAIAEMRTYGEGFIIADQAPGLLDMAVIRNTNTKIIMRLPDESDRVLVGKAAGLTDDQIVELSRLDCGVAAVFQNHWLEAVLCKVDEFPKSKEKPLSYTGNDPDAAAQAGVPRMNTFFEKLLGKPSKTELSAEEVDRIRTWIDRLNVPHNAKIQLISLLGAKETQAPLYKGELLYRIVNGNDFLKYAGTVSNPEEGMRTIDRRIMEMLEVSAQLAEEIRKQVFLFAAAHIQDMPQHGELLYYGGEIR